MSDTFGKEQYDLERPSVAEIQPDSHPRREPCQPSPSSLFQHPDEDGSLGSQQLT